VAKYLLELYVANADQADVDALASRARAAAAQASATGRPIACLRSLLVPGDETCFLLFEAGAADDVRFTADRAGLTVGRITEAIVDADNAVNSGRSS
jgi:hypothetical protein